MSERRAAYRARGNVSALSLPDVSAALKALEALSPDAANLVRARLAACAHLSDDPLALRDALRGAAEVRRARGT